MSALRALWSSIQGDPKFMRRLNGWLTIMWIAMIPLSFITHWINSVAFISTLSLLALVSGHWSGWQAARVECEQVRHSEEQKEHPVEQRVVEAIVRETEVSRASAESAGTPSGDRTRDHEPRRELRPRPAARGVRFP